jgi:hypothetical protein
VRYYTIKIFEPEAAPNATPIKVYSSKIGNRLVPNALDIEMDVPVTFFAEPMGGAYVRVWGVDIETLVQASNFNGKSIEVYGGMEKGLPLANPRQNGLLAAGTIQQAFGNWIGTDMTLDLVFTAGNVQSGEVINATINWRAGTLLSEAIDVTLRTAFPTYQREINISPNLKFQSDQPGFYGTMLQFAKYVNEASLGILRTRDYRGVHILLKGKKFIVTDGTTRTTVREIKYTDLVGQITWLSSAKVSITTVMRADLQSGDFVRLPPGLTITTPQSFSQARVREAFKGVFQLTAGRHTGRFRMNSATSWVSVFEAAGPITSTS